MKILNYIYNVFLDKLLLVGALASKRDELYNARITKDYKVIEEIWFTLFTEKFSINVREIKEIFNLNITAFIPSVSKKIDYYIKNRFWCLLNYHNIINWDLSNEDLFRKPALIVYAVKKNDGECIILVVKIQDKKFDMLNMYEFKSFPLWKMTHRQLVFRTERGFLAI